MQRSAETGGSGKFAIAGLPIVGTYELTASKSGFSDAKVPEITLIGRRQTTVNVRLNISGESTAIQVGITSQLLARSLQFQSRLNF